MYDDVTLCMIQVVAAKLSYMDLVMYAGYHRRNNIVKECMIVDTEVMCVSCVCVCVCACVCVCVCVCVCCLHIYTHIHTYIRVPTK